MWFRVLLVAALSLCAVARASDDGDSDDQSGEPIQDRSCFAGPCADVLAACLARNDTCAPLIRDPVSHELVLSSLLSVEEQPTNKHWRKLKICFDFNCAEDSQRACSLKAHKMALHLPGGACASAPCHLTNDFSTTETAGECRQRCLEHTPPEYSESCSAWSWGARSGSKDYQHCFLMQHTPVPQPHRQFTSGACHGGPTRTEEQIAQEKHLCEHIMSKPSNLQVWLKVRKQISLPAERFTELYTYMEILHICPDGKQFEEALAFFTPPPPKEDSLFEKIFMRLAAVYDFVSSNFKLLATITTVLLPVLLPLICSVLAWLCHVMPVLEKILIPILPSALKQPLKDHMERAHPKPQPPAPAPAEGEQAAVNHLTEPPCSPEPQAHELLHEFDTVPISPPRSSAQGDSVSSRWKPPESVRSPGNSGLKNRKPSPSKDF